MVHVGDDPGCNHKGSVPSILENIKILQMTILLFASRNHGQMRIAMEMDCKFFLIAIKG
jgi:hypothetical protein